MQAKQLIAKQLADKFASITFVKKDGTVRKINGRMGVTKDLKGGVNTTAKFGQYLTIYSLRDKGYRNINLETVQRIAARGQVWEF